MCMHECVHAGKYIHKYLLKKLKKINKLKTNKFEAYCIRTT